MLLQGILRIVRLHFHFIRVLLLVSHVKFQKYNNSISFNLLLTLVVIFVHLNHFNIFHRLILTLLPEYFQPLGLYPLQQLSFVLRLKQQPPRYIQHPQKANAKKCISEDLFGKNPANHLHIREQLIKNHHNVTSAKIVGKCLRKHMDQTSCTD